MGCWRSRHARRDWAAVAGDGEEARASPDVAAAGGQAEEFLRDVGGVVEPPVTQEEKFLQLDRREIRMAPRHARAVEAVQVGFRDQSIPEEVVVLLGSGDGGEDVEGSHVRSEEPQRPEMLQDSPARVGGEAEDI